MRLRFIHEGFSIGTGSHDWEREFMAGGQPHSDRDRFEAQIRGQALYFTDHDNPHDVVKVVPALTARNLEHFVDRRHLTSFRGGKIYYAFKTVAAEEYRNEAIGSVMGAIDAALEHCPPATTSSELFDRARRETNPQFARTLQQAGTQVDRIYDMYGRSSPHKHNFTLGQARDAVIKTSNRGYVVELAYEFARRLKDPTPADMPIVQKFLELTVQQFRKLAGTTGSGMPLYDYVVAPESHGKFNGWLAYYLCQETGAQFLTVNKLQARNVKVDRDELLARARTLETASPAHQTGPGQYKLNLRGGKDTRRFDDPRRDNREDFAHAWADNEADKWQSVLSGLRPDQKPQIKHSAPPDKRRYLNMFDKEGTEAAQGKEVLLVDDNVAGGGTIELVHRILNSLSPQPTRIDIFVPLLIQDLS